MDFKLTDKEKKILIRTARWSIKSKLFSLSPEYPDPTSTLETHCGAFVSLHINSNLRGCIGYVSAIKPLYLAVREMAQSAAFSDPRFPPLSKSEYDNIDIEISVISPMKRIHNINEIEIGLHGILVHKGTLSGLLLPQVATEYGWNREQFLAHTCQKAGLPGNSWKTNDIDIDIFSAIVFNEHELGMDKK